MSLFLKKLDFNPQVESYFQKRSVVGAVLSICSVLLCILFGIEIIRNENSTDLYTIDNKIENKDVLSMTVQFNHIPCEFIKVSIRNSYENDLTDRAVISTSSEIKELFFHNSTYHRQLLSLSSDSIRQLNELISKGSSDKCYGVNGVQTDGKTICKTCADYVRFYKEKGYKTSKLINGLYICQDYTFQELQPRSCLVNVKTPLSNLKSLVSIDVSRFKQAVSSDDFEDDNLLSLLSETPKIISVSINDRRLSIPSPKSFSSLMAYDYDISLIPNGNSNSRSYDSVSRVTERELPYLNVNETPGITFVFDYSGLMRLQSMSLFRIILEIVITCGGIISVVGYLYSVAYQFLRKRKSINVDYQLHTN